MRPLLLVFALTLFACTPQGVPRLPPSSSFYFPTGLLYADGDASSPDGYLYVNSANFDRRYDYGSLSALNLSRLADNGLPPLGSPAPDPPMELTNLGLGPTAQVLLQSYAGELASFPIPGGVRLFTPSRGEGDFLHIVDAQGAALSCHFRGPSAQDCSAGSPSLTAFQNVGNGLPRAPQPVGVGISRDGQGQVWVTHVQGADSPYGSAKNITAYVVELSANNPTVDASNFIELGIGGTNSVAVGARYAYLTGRYVSPKGYLVRLVDRSGTVPLINPTLENVFIALEARGIALRADEQRLFIAARSPDTLLVVDVKGVTTRSPSLTLVRAVPLPQGPNGLQLIPRPGGGVLVAVACSIGGEVVIYDDDLGELVSENSAVGAQPFAVTVQARGKGARLFVSNFGDGRVSVLDLPDLAVPQDLRLMAHLGSAQPCLLDPTTSGGCISQ